MDTDPRRDGAETVGMATTTVERGHEPRDASVRGVLWVGVGLVAIAVVIQIALYFHMVALWHARQREVPPPSPVAGALPPQPPEPRLQTAPSVDLHALRAAEDAQLGSYGWVDRRAGVVHVPIDRAMDLVAAEQAKR